MCHFFKSIKILIANKIVRIAIKSHSGAENQRTWTNRKISRPTREHACTHTHGTLNRNNLQSVPSRVLRHALYRDH